jgi:hypothetical protein
MLTADQTCPLEEEIRDSLINGSIYNMHAAEVLKDMWRSFI